METPQQQDLFGGMMEPSVSNDFVFGGQQEQNVSTDMFGDANTALFGAEQPAQQEAVDMMLAGSDGEDDLFGAPEIVAQEPMQESAIAQWEKQKQAEIAETENVYNENDAKLKQMAAEKLQQFYATLREAQEKREQHNKDVDEQTIATQQSPSENKWENVVAYIDFNRSDLHEKDVSRMKSLLLQLKH